MVHQAVVEITRSSLLLLLGKWTAVREANKTVTNASHFEKQFKRKNLIFSNQENVKFFDEEKFGQYSDYKHIKSDCTRSQKEKSSPQLRQHIAMCVIWCCF